MDDDRLRPSVLNLNEVFESQFLVLQEQGIRSNYEGGPLFLLARLCRRFPHLLDASNHLVNLATDFRLQFILHILSVDSIWKFTSLA